MDYKELYVAVKMWKGTIDDVSVYRKEPQNLEPIDDTGDNGNFIYLTQIEDIEEVMNSENSTEFDVGYYKGLLDYESKCQSILWEYISEKDFDEIQERLNNEM